MKGENLIKIINVDHLRRTIVESETMTEMIGLAVAEGGRATRREAERGGETGRKGRAKGAGGTKMMVRGGRRRRAGERRSEFLPITIHPLVPGV